MSIEPGNEASADNVASLLCPMGRLSLSQDPVPAADQIGKSILYYKPFTGLSQPLYRKNFGKSIAISGFFTSSLSLAGYVAGEILDIFAVRSGTMPGLQALSWGAASGSKGMALTNATNASPIVVTAPGHGLTTGAQAYINGVQGNGAANGVWTITYVDTNRFTLNGSAGNGTYAGGGYFSARDAANMSSWNQVGTGGGSPNILTKYLNAAGSESWYLGSIKMSGAGVCEDSMAKRFVWNAFNQVPRPMRKIDITNSWSYTTASWRNANGNAANQIECVFGGYGSVSAEVAADVELASNTGFCFASIGLGGTAPVVSNVFHTRGKNTNAGAVEIGLSSVLRMPISGGYAPLTWLEYGAEGGICKFYGGLARGISGFVMA